ncbi:MAG: hypothetical protein ABSB91_08315 [Sedimentisphaerales bacterium]
MQTNLPKTKEAFEILEARWPEVVFIIGIDILSLFFNKLLYLVSLNITTFQKLVDAAWGFAFIVVTVLLIIGFQRTLYLEGINRQSPITLLRAGAHFFWRMLGFGLIYLPVYFILSGMSFLVIKRFTSIETSFWETSITASLVRQLCFTISEIILIKPLLFIFPLIVVLDCRILKSFKLLKHCKLSNAKELVALFIISMLLTFLWAFLPSVASATSLTQFAFLIAQTVTQSFIGLIIAVMAVRFVASLNLVYDDIQTGLDSQNLLKPSK